MEQPLVTPSYCIDITLFSSAWHPRSKTRTAFHNIRTLNRDTDPKPGQKYYACTESGLAAHVYLPGEQRGWYPDNSWKAPDPSGCLLQHRHWEIFLVYAALFCWQGHTPFRTDSHVRVCSTYHADDALISSAIHSSGMHQPRKEMKCYSGRENPDACIKNQQVKTMCCLWGTEHRNKSVRYGTSSWTADRDLVAPDFEVASILVGKVVSRVRRTRDHVSHALWYIPLTTAVDEYHFDQFPRETVTYSKPLPNSLIGLWTLPRAHIWLTSKTNCHIGWWRSLITGDLIPTECTGMGLIPRQAMFLRGTWLNEY